MRFLCKYILAAPSMLNIMVKGRNELLVVWSNDNSYGKSIEYVIFWRELGQNYQQSVTQNDKKRTLSRRLTGLQEATAYEIAVARNSDDGKTLGRKRSKIAMTRSGLNILELCTVNLLIYPTLTLAFIWPSPRSTIHIPVSNSL